jgi:lipopolysaccharide export system permease protein
MTIFSRYVFKQTGSALLLILLSLTGIVWISLALRELNVVTSMGQSAFTLIKMTTLGLPNFIAVIAPFALLITVIHTLNRLNGDSEIIVLTASGATAWTITRPVVLLALVVALGVSFANHFAMPWSLRLLREIIVDVRTDLLTQVIQPGRFSSPEKGLTFHIRDRALNGELSGLIMHDARNPDQIQTYLAEHGYIVEQPGGSYLIMTDGHILRTAKSETQVIAFDKYAVDLDRFEQKTSEAPDLKPRERYFGEIVNPEPTSQSYKREPNRFTTELHERFSSALYPIVFALMGVAVIGQAQSTRQNRNLRMGICFATGVGLRLAGLAVNNLVTINAKLFPLLYIIPVVGILVSLVMIVRGARHSRSPTLIDRIVDAASPLFERLRALLPSRFIPAFRS